MKGGIAEEESEPNEGANDTSIYSNNKVILNANGKVSYFQYLRTSST